MDKNNELNTALAIFFIASAVVLVAGLFAIPVIEEAQAKKGAVSEHISPKGTENQSPQGTIKSGNIPCPSYSCQPW